MSPSLSHNSTEITLLLVNLLIKAAYSILLKTCDLSLLGARFLYKYIFIFCKPASPSLEPASRESLFASPERIPPKNPKYGHNALTWCLLHAQCLNYGHNALTWCLLHAQCASIMPNRPVRYSRKIEPHAFFDETGATKRNRTLTIFFFFTFPEFLT